MNNQKNLEGSAKDIPSETRIAMFKEVPCSILEVIPWIISVVILSGITPTIYSGITEKQPDQFQKELPKEFLNEWKNLGKASSWSLGNLPAEVWKI